MASQDLPTTPELPQTPSEQLQQVIELESCSRKPERISQVISEYEYTRAFIAIMEHFPEALSNILVGQAAIRRDTTTYEIRPGIIAFPKISYVHHRVDVLEFTKEVMEAVYRYTEGYTEINIGILNRFLFEYDRAVTTQEDQRSEEDLIILKLSKLLGVNEDILAAMRIYVDKDKQVKEVQRTSTFARQEEARAFASWQRDRFQEGEF